MRTSTLAKYKTAAQMIGIGYVILYLAHKDDPSSIWVWIFILGPIALPLGLIAYRLVKCQEQGPRSRIMMALMILAVVYRVAFGPTIAIQISLWIITTMTVVSGFSYVVDAWSALKGEPGSCKEALRFVLDGLLVPVSFVLLLGRYKTDYMSTAIILVITLELVVGGLGNLLAGKKITPRFRWMALKSLLQLAFASTAFASLYFNIGPFIGEACIVCAFVVTMVYAIVSFWRHRAVYLTAI
jgi:phosphatidylglycerophosphate synthase